MKKLYFLTFFLICLQFNSVKAQWVTIPDAGFVAWLTQQYPSCMNGNLMDTTCSQIVNQNFVSITYMGNIFDLTGIEYFDNLLVFYCHNNIGLSNIPALPPNIEVLDCHLNELSYLPPLPNTLVALNCSGNYLTSMPQLPNTMNSLDCSFNNIGCFYNLPLLVDTIILIPNSFTCIPNETNVSLGFPLCIDNEPINNPNNCNSNVNISGYIFTDQNGSCTYNVGELGTDNVPVKLFDSQNNLISQTYSVNGIYGFALNQPGNYKVKIVHSNLPFGMACAQADSQMVNLTAVNNGISNINFPIQCSQAYDLHVQSVSAQGWVFPGQIHTLNSIVTSNEDWYNLDCNSSLFSGTVSITINGPISYISPASNALIPQVNNNTFTYSITNFQNLTPSSFGLNLKTDTTAQAGNQICVNVSISPSPLDANAANNVYNFCYNVVNSYDPNIKEVYPINVPPGYSDWLTYTIHFQNTGSAPAFNIRLKDTLDGNLNLNTFEVLSFSHDAITSFNGNIITIRFNNIMLPDSTTDYEGSMGYFQYRIKPKPNQQLGAAIENTAYIYFDYNPPIITNTTINNFVTALSEHVNSNHENFILYPNPSNGIFEFKDSNNIKTVEVFNMMGELILCQANSKEINLKGFPNGIYMTRINGTLGYRLIKE